MTPISKELSEQIEREAEAYGKKHGWQASNGYNTGFDLEQSYVAGATAYAHYKERFEQAKKALEEIEKIDHPITNVERSDAILKIKSIAHVALLASWKEEGKDQNNKTQ